jgi:HSP20 family protein
MAEAVKATLGPKGRNVVIRAYGKFERSIRLPMAVQAERVTATYREGMLEVRLPKVEEVRPKEIKIDVS